MSVIAYILIFLGFFALVLGVDAGFAWLVMTGYNTWLVPAFHYPVFPFLAWFLAVVILSSIAGMFSRSS